MLPLRGADSCCPLKRADSIFGIDPGVACFALTPSYLMSGFQPEEQGSVTVDGGFDRRYATSINGVAMPALKDRPKVMLLLRGANFCRPLRGL